MMKFVHVNSPENIKVAKELFTEYATSLEINLDFQDFERDFQDLPGEYAPPFGRLILAYYNKLSAGCVALKKLTNEICEMKRLYVKPEFRGKGIGKKLTEKIIYEAKGIGYLKMRLDTISSMKPAITIYRSFGFYEIEPYYDNPVKEALYFELDLKSLLKM